MIFFLIKLILNIYIIFCLESYRKFIKTNYNKILVILFSILIDAILLHVIADYYIILMYYIFRVLTLKFRILYLYLYYRFYNDIEYIYNRELYWLLIPNISMFPKLYYMLLLSTIILIYVQSIFLILIYAIIFSDLKFYKFSFEFDEAYFNRFEDRNIVLFESGKSKLNLYINELLESSDVYVIGFSFDESIRLHLIPYIDFKFLEKKRWEFP